MILTDIHSNARIGQRTQISSFTTIAGDVEIGDDCRIGPHVTILDGARIGNGVQIHAGAVISGEPQDLKYKGEYTLTYIGDETIIREYVTIHRGTSDKMETRIGEKCLIMAYSHIAHDCIIGNGCIFSNNATLAGHITVDDYVTIGGVVAVQQFVKIGKSAFITGGSLVRTDVPPFVKAAREPLQYMGVNSVGMERRGYSQEVISKVQDIYRAIFVQGNGIISSLEKVETEFAPCPERDLIINFIRNSKGVIKGM
jgi:UDP-N-acetylglucosamine acyltransferase